MNEINKLGGIIYYTPAEYFIYQPDQSVQTNLLPFIIFKLFIRDS